MKHVLQSLAFVLLLSVVMSAQTVCFNATGITTTITGASTILDSNRDGKLDVAILAHSKVGNATLTESYLGNGNGTFTPLKAYPGPGIPYAIRAGDFNGDGNPDLAIGFLAHKGTGGIVSTLLGNGDGTFGNPHNVQVARRVDQLVTGDFNGDGKLDVAATTGQDFSHAADVELLLGNGDGSLQAPIVVSTFPYYTPALTTADLNHDGKLDLVTLGGDSTGANQVLTVLLGNGDGTFQSAVTYTDGTNQKPAGIAVADVDGDGNLDVIAPATPGLDVFYGTGSGTLTGPNSISMFLTPSAVAAIDIFGNGREDLVAGIYNGSLGIAVNNGNKNFSVQYMGVSDDPGIPQIGDFNNDGKADVLFPFNTGGTGTGITVLLNCS